MLVKAAETTAQGRYVFRKKRGAWHTPQYLTRQKQTAAKLMRRLEKKGQARTSQEGFMLSTLYQNPDAVVFKVYTRVRTAWGTPREITRTTILPPSYLVREVKTLPAYPPKNGA
jgi:hypothetical protein